MGGCTTWGGANGEGPGQVDDLMTNTTTDELGDDESSQLCWTWRRWTRHHISVVLGVSTARHCPSGQVPCAVQSASQY